MQKMFGTGEQMNFMGFFVNQLASSPILRWEMDRLDR